MNVLISNYSKLLKHIHSWDKTNLKWYCEAKQKYRYNHSEDDVIVQKQESKLVSKR